MKIAVPRERAPGERRVALVPETAGKFVKAGITVAIERDAGSAAGFLDEAYAAAGATIAADDAATVADADIVVRVNKPTDAELDGLKRGAMIVGFLVLEGRLKNPIMPLRILRVRGLLSSSFVRGFLFIGMYGCFFVGTLYLEHVLNYGALTTGLAFLPMTLVVATLSMGITAKLVGRFGPKQVLLPAIVSVNPMFER